MSLHKWCVNPSKPKIEGVEILCLKMKKRHKKVKSQTKSSKEYDL